MPAKIPDAGALMAIILAFLGADAGVKAALPAGIFTDFEPEHAGDRYAVILVLSDSTDDTISNTAVVWNFQISIRVVTSGVDAQKWCYDGDHAIDSALHLASLPGAAGFTPISCFRMGSGRGWSDQKGNWNYVRFYKIVQQG